MRKALVLALLAGLLPLSVARGALPQDDAGSGRDAPDSADASFRIVPGRVYDGLIEGVLTDGDDYYAFHALAGATVEVRAASVLGCVYVYDSAGTQLTFGCPIGYALNAQARTVVPAAGTYFVSYGYVQPHTYTFSVGVDAPAPDPAPVPVDVFASAGRIPAVAPASTTGKHTVVAVVDTGINPYHEFFRAPGLTAHPSTWLSGFPAGAKPVALSLGAASHAAANAADAAKWAGLQRSTYDPAEGTYDARLYTFPGTRIVGAVSFGEFEETGFPPADPRPVRDDHGHGTHSAGLAGGANLPAADGNVLIVAVEIGKGQFEEGVRWAARQPWIDALSVSLSQVANVPVTSSPTGSREGMEWATREAALSGKPVFMAAGNGVSNTGLAPDKCSTYTSPFTGPRWVTRVGAAEPGDGSPTWWHCVPVDVVARTNVLSPSYDSFDAADDAGGTSAATPNVAGHFAHLLLANRRSGVNASRVRVRDHLLHAAAPVAAKPGAHDPSAYPLSLADQGYGLVDRAALDAARTRLFAGTGPAPRPETEAWFAQDAEVRESLWGVDGVMSGDPAVPDEAGPAKELVEDATGQDDAGSGRDAGDTRAGAVAVSPGRRYDGTLDGVTDDDDWYTFKATAGQLARFHLSTAATCVDLISPSGVVLSAVACPLGYRSQAYSRVLDETGTWTLGIGYPVAQPYSFAFTLDGSPPPAVSP